MEKLTDFIRSAVQLKQPDKQVAETLRHFKMVEKLDDRTIEELQSLGAGPKTVAALKELGDASASLPEAAPPAPKPVIVPLEPPDSDRTGQDHRRGARIRAELHQEPAQLHLRSSYAARRGSRRHRLELVSPRHHHGSSSRYNGQHEDYEVILKNDQPVTNVKMEQLGGTVSAGEFGTHDERDLRNR